MKKFAGAVVIFCACAGMAFAQAQTMAAPSKADVAQAVKQLEVDWMNAAKAGDVDKLSAIIADDWVSIDPDGSKATKASMLADLKSGSSKLESYTMGPMDVKLLGRAAVVQGSDTEKSMDKGKDSSGKYVWMDVFAYRDGKWMAVRSQTAMVK